MIKKLKIGLAGIICLLGHTSNVYAIPNVNVIYDNYDPEELNQNTDVIATDCNIEISASDILAQNPNTETLYIGFDYGTNATKILDAAAWVQEYTKNAGYHYDDAHYWDGQDMYCSKHNTRAVSCDRGVAFSLYKAGYTDMTPSSLGLGALDSYLKNHDALRMESASELEPGDIVFYDKNHNGTLEATDHVFIYAGGNHIYDWGSDARIQNPDGNNYCGVNPAEMGWAYRLP